MTQQTKALQLLGLCQRARRLATGEDLVVKAIQKQTAYLVLVGHDLSPLTLKKLSDKSHFYEIPISKSFSTMQLSDALGMKRGIVAILDEGFAKKMITLLD